MKKEGRYKKTKRYAQHQETSADDHRIHHYTMYTINVIYLFFYALP